MAAEDIEYRPVINSDNEDVADIKRWSFNRLQLSLCIVLVISAVLQFIAISTPGWRISNAGLKLSSYESIFYTKSCLKYNTGIGNETIEACDIISFHDAFRRRYDEAGDAAKASIVRTYNLVVQHQINVQIVWLLTVWTIVFQVFKLARPNEGFPRLTIIIIIALTCACPLMFQVLFKGFVEVDTLSRLSGYASIGTGFPYSLFLYCISFIHTIACLVLIVKQIFDQLRKKDQSHAETNVKFDRLKLEYEAEVEAFKRYRLKSRLRPESGGSYRRDRRSRGENGGSHSPRHSPRPRDRSPPRDHGRDHSPMPRGRSPQRERSRDHSPRLRHHSPPPREHFRDHSPRPRDHSPSRERNRDYSPRPRDRSPPRERSRDYSPRPRDRSPPREINKDHSPRPRDRPPAREHYKDHSPRPRNRSPPQEHYRNHSPRPDHRSTPQLDRGDHSRHRSPPRENRDNHSPRHRSPPREDGEQQSARDSNYDNPTLVVTPPVELHPVTVSSTKDIPVFDQSIQSNDNTSDSVKESDTKTEDIELSIAKL